MAMTAAEFRICWFESLLRVSCEQGSANLYERSLVARVAHHLQNMVHASEPEAIVDIDYQANGDGRKTGLWVGSKKTFLSIEVDLIVHTRGGKAEGANWFCAEFKLDKANQAGDVAKVAFLLDRVIRQPPVPAGPYKLGALVRFERVTRAWTTSWVFPGHPVINIPDITTAASDRARHVYRANEAVVNQLLSGVSEVWDPSMSVAPDPPMGFNEEMVVIP